ncbi:ATP-binding protein [Streptomyces sp. NPDC056716]|uniref:ATP-binding protein n=1 Tax=unclassified Streptomyces TaxID=2593676 RepID=UPI0036C01B8F
MDRMTYWFQHAAESRAVPFGRQFAANALDDWGLAHMRESVTLIASELLTNAVRATGTIEPGVTYRDRETLPLVAVRLRMTGGKLLVEVYDTSRVLPRMRTPESDAEDGRGLPLVTLLSERWDSYHHPSGGKVVYAVMPLVRPPVEVAEAEAKPHPEPLPGRVLNPRGESRVGPDAALLTRLEGLLECRPSRLVALGP